MRGGCGLTLYCDTSLLVAALWGGERPAPARDWLAAHPADLAISPWVATEFAAVLARALRAGQVTAAARDAMAARFDILAARSLRLLPIDAATFGAAAGFAMRAGLGAGDALHLAVCAAEGARLCTLDRRLAAAGPGLGVATELVRAAGKRPGQPHEPLASGGAAGR
ncbi:type II toxin-antitoxin system VapC family toxin [Paracraurococcus ruber]|uniref:type II toxin-antitoxin system VapC family toxin n=1 Tax=Paracraurococcus ruber TaxID=77675 RepID=UPI003083F11F